MRFRTPLQRSWLILHSVYGVLPKAYRLSPKVCFRHREPQSGEKLKAWVARVRRDFGPLVQNAGQAQGKHGSDPFAPLLARKIRERLIRHGISHRVEKTRAGTLSAHPGYVCRWGENGRGSTNGKITEMSSDPHSVVVWQRPGNGHPHPICVILA